VKRAFAAAVVLVLFCHRTAEETVAHFDSPHGIVVDSSADIYVADTNNHAIRKITPAGVVTTFAGTAGRSGSADGVGNAARFSLPYGLTADRAGNLYVADTWNSMIRKIAPSGAVTTIAGHPAPQWSTEGGAGPKRFHYPTGIAADHKGNVYVGDGSEGTVRKITPDGAVTFFVRVRSALGMTTDADGNLFVANEEHQTVEKITPDGEITTVAGRTEAIGNADGVRDAARFHDPHGVAIDRNGNIYVADTWNSTIRKITPAGEVTTLAGLAGRDGSTDGLGSAARFNGPEGIAVDDHGNIYVADTGNHTIRKISPTGMVTTVAGEAGVRGRSDTHMK
jgi:sugar lactone lactonase YvrE